MKKILLIDNYDSFTYNLRQLIALHFNGLVDVVRNDAVGLDELNGYDALVISPGPKRPAEAGISKQAINRYYTSKPIFGVCLGLQAMNEVFGGTTVRAPYPVHGKTSMVTLNPVSRLFSGLPESFAVARYHSLIICPPHEPKLTITAITADGSIPMAAEHPDFPIMGVQFHPESFMCEFGHEMIENFLRFI